MYYVLWSTMVFFRNILMCDFFWWRKVTVTADSVYVSWTLRGFNGNCWCLMVFNDVFRIRIHLMAFDIEKVAGQCRNVNVAEYWCLMEMVFAGWMLVSVRQGWCLMMNTGVWYWNLTFDGERRCSWMLVFDGNGVWCWGLVFNRQHWCLLVNIEVWLSNLAFDPER